MDFIVFFKFLGSTEEQQKYFTNLVDLQGWLMLGEFKFEYINACTTDEHEEIVFSSVEEILEAK